MNHNAQWTVAKVLEWTRDYFESKGGSSSRLDAELLLAHVLGTDRIGLYLDHHKPMTPKELTEMRSLVKRRAKFEPIHYILGFREFWSLQFMVNENVLIPRPDSETLVEVSLRYLNEADKPYQVLDLCCGSGALGIALASERKDSTVLGTDICPQALDVAQRNAHHLGIANIEFIQSDLFKNIDGMFDLIISNPPYIASRSLSDLMVDVRDYEPMLALDGGQDGLEFYRAIVQQAVRFLKPSGLLLVEIGFDQRAEVEELINESEHFVLTDTETDLHGNDRVIVARHVLNESF